MGVMADHERADDGPPQPQPKAEGGAGEPLGREEFEAGMRFVHRMEMQTKLAVERVEATLAALLEALHAGGRIGAEELARYMDDARQNARARSRSATHVEVGPPVDKYALGEGPDIDCEALIPICQGRCCRLRFPLSFQDLDEGTVRWDYAQPYRIRQRAEDGYCVHADPEARLCTVYEHRPAICRQYDCRQDKRIWSDFDKRIPAPLGAVRDQPVLIERIGIKRPER